MHPDLIRRLKNGNRSGPILGDIGRACRLGTVKELREILATLTSPVDAALACVVEAAVLAADRQERLPVDVAWYRSSNDAQRIVAKIIAHSGRTWPELCGTLGDEQVEQAMLASDQLYYRGLIARQPTGVYCLTPYAFDVLAV